MKDAAHHVDSIVADIRSRGCVLMLDFDGVIAPIVEIPSMARISSVARQSLIACAKKMPVAIITGRTLSDIEKRVGLSDVIYAGNHGVVWKMDGHIHRNEIPRNAMAAFSEARNLLLQHAKLFPGLNVEYSDLALALGYRTLSAVQAAEFRIGAIEKSEIFVRAGDIRILDNLFTFEIMPMSEWTKGSCARHIYNLTRKGSAVAVYIGDSLTDEDAFREFATSGITFRVGKSDTSVAQYYFNSRSGVNRFLCDLSNQTNSEGI